MPNSTIQVTERDGSPAPGARVALGFNWFGGGITDAVVTDRNGVAVVPHGNTGAAVLYVNGRYYGEIDTPGEALIRLGESPPSRSNGSPGAGAEAAEALEARFRRLADAWWDDTDVLSSTDVFTHPAYQEIIGMGPAVLPLLLADMRKTGAHWFWALRAITGENPVPRDAQGDIGRMTEAWLSWGRERGMA